MGFRGQPEKKDILPSMEDGARTLRKKRAAYVGTREWVFIHQAGWHRRYSGNSCPGSSLNCRFVFLTERFGIYVCLFFFELALCAEGSLINRFVVSRDIVPSVR